MSDDARWYGKLWNAIVGEQQPREPELLTAGWIGKICSERGYPHIEPGSVRFGEGPRPAHPACICETDPAGDIVRAMDCPIYHGGPGR